MSENIPECRARSRRNRGRLQIGMVGEIISERWATSARNAGHLDRSALRVMGAIETCRTAALGGHVERCNDCGHTVISYNSCRNRHCPKCQAGAAREWLDARAADLLPVEYFHIVFTLPAAIAAIAFQNKAAVYALLFEAASQTLKTIAADPKHLGAEIGATMVLHTWGQTLTHHPHVHCIVPGGGLSPTSKAWIASRRGFFLPVRVLSRFYRRLFLRKLMTAHCGGRLHFFNGLAKLADPAAFAAHLAQPRRAEWVVYAKKPFAGPEQVLAYLSRYTHRIAISNGRLVALGDTMSPSAGAITLMVACRKSCIWKHMSLSAGFCSTCFPMASSASATMASSPTAIASPNSWRSAPCCLPPPRRLQRLAHPAISSRPTKPPRPPSRALAAVGS